MNTLNITPIVEKVKFAPMSAEKKSKVEVSIFPLPSVRNLKTAKRQAENSLLLASRLKVANESDADVYQLVLSDLLEVEADEKANGVLHNFNDAKGREYSCAIGAQFAYSRLSDSYQRKQTARQRKRLQVAFMEKLDFIKSNNYEVCFFTPTYPNLLGVGFEKNAEFHAKVWELFLRDSLIRRFFSGGYSRTEFTLGEKKKRFETGASFDLNVHGLNFHNHALIILKKSLAFGDSHQLENRLEAIKQGKISVSKADKRLLDNSLHIVKKWSDCLRIGHKEVFGKCLKIKTKSKNSKVDFQKVDLAEIEHHSNENRKGILFEVCGYQAKQSDFKGLTPELLAEAERVFRNKRILVPFGCFKQSKASAKKADNHDEKELLDVSDALLKQHTYRKDFEPIIDTKFLCYQTFADAKKSLKKIGIEMVEAGKRNEWLIHLGKIKNYLITTNRNNLLKRFPNAVFTDLTGKRYYGANARLLLEGKQSERFSFNRETNVETSRYAPNTEHARRATPTGERVVLH